MALTWKHRLWIIPPILIAIIALILISQTKKPPQKKLTAEHAVKAMTIHVPKIFLTPKSIGYGMTEASRTWEAVAEVDGQINWVSDKFKSGHLIAQGTDLLHIDETKYQLSLTQVDAELEALEIKDLAIRTSLKLEERSYISLKKEIERKRKLLKQSTISSSDFETAERSLWKSELLVQNLKNTLAYNNSERKLLEIQKEKAQIDLDNTRFIAPFDVRITHKDINLEQYANKGKLLFSADDIRHVEVEARFPVGKLRPLISKQNTISNINDQPALERVPGAVKLNALVRLRTATHTMEWKARVDRVSGVIDPETQSIGVVVIVDDPYEQAQPGKRPPLLRNTFVEVELSQTPETKSVVIPVSAIHNGQLYIVDQAQRLKIRKIKTHLIQDDVAVITKGLEEGETLVVSKLIPAIEGMLLETMEDKKALKRLKKTAQ